MWHTTLGTHLVPDLLLKTWSIHLSMPLAQFTNLDLAKRPLCRATIRMVSTMVGDSGNVYTQGEVLQHHRNDPTFNILKVESGNQSFVLKRVPRQFYNLSLHLAAEFAGSHQLRIHVDRIQNERILIYRHYKSTLLPLIRDDPEFPLAGRKRILRQVGEAIREFHNKNWVHIDIKPDNILVNWTRDSDGNKVVNDAALGDFDIAFHSEDGKPYHTPYAVGNAMWRSPEGQTGRGMTKASDIYSFGLVCIYTMGGGDLLLLDDYQELVGQGIPPEQEIVTRHFSYFGPVPEALFEYTDNVNWSAAFKAASETADKAIKEQPELRFEHWSKDLGSEAQDMISAMMNLDPVARPTIDQVLASCFWQDDI